MPSEIPDDKLYIVLISVHGLIRGKDIELGRDADTGGQVLYVVELARELARHPQVGRVDLLTRQVIDPKVDPGYAEPEESLGDNAYLIRLQFGPRRYLRKEVLWPHLDGCIDQSLQHIRTIGRVPDVVHTHYADAGLVGARLAGLLGVPLIHTGHSLGMEKRRRLLDKGAREDTIDEQYNFRQRIEAEEIVLGTAALVIASTQQEVDEQYSEYDNYHSKRMVVIPPGVDISRFHPPTGDEQQAHITQTLERFLSKPDKPFILALSRPDERKNIASLVHAYGQSRLLQGMANLVIIAGNRDEITAMDKGPREVLSEILFLIDKYDLYGRIAFPKHHHPDDVPVLYRLAALQRGVFINPALTEPFGLTLIEAAASGLPIVATHDGGPKEITKNLHNGLLIDPNDINDIKDKLLDAFSDEQLWQSWSDNGASGANRHYSWTGHVKSYIKQLHNVLEERVHKPRIPPLKSRLPTVDRLAFSAIDNALFGNADYLRELNALLKKDGRHIGYGLATGRSLESARQFLAENNLQTPDILITSTGSEIYYYHQGRGFEEDQQWQRHIDYRWKPDELKKIMRRVLGSKLRPKADQGIHKLCYNYYPGAMPSLREIKQVFRQHDLHAKLILTENRILDILPIRASKGLAIRYLALKWGIPLERILVVGDSGNDEEMLLGDTLAVIVGNHSGELEKLRNRPRVYFSEEHYARGIIDGIRHYNFFDEIQVSE